MTTSDQPTLRPALDSDWPAIWPIWHEIVAAGDTYTYDPDTTYEQARAGWLAPLPDECWVAVADVGSATGPNPALLGTYHLAPNHGGPGAHIANGSYMVAAAARGGGVGRALVAHSLERARAGGYLGLQFNAVAATNERAIALYERLGFVTLARVPNGFRHPAVGLVDLLIMFHDLS
jgi:ribosomal protein S18 acetylase RimI-like enzyme